jgi:hypothetical protein
MLLMTSSLLDIESSLKCKICVLLKLALALKGSAGRAARALHDAGNHRTDRAMMPIVSVPALAG